MASVIRSGTRGDWTWPHGREGLLLLLQAHECAADSGSDEWDFALELSSLQKCGVSDTELRWLLKMKWVEHRMEATLLGDDTRCFLPQGGLKFTADSCFVLTLEGECHVRILLHPSQAAGAHLPHGQVSPGPSQHGPSQNGHDQHGINGHVAHSHEAVAKALSHRPDHPFPPLHPEASPAVQKVEEKSLILPKDQRPTWDTDRKELWFGPHLIKRFRFQSPNQETILIVFHEENWPVKIDDPLTPVANQTSRQRLHDAIKNLNRHRLNRVIRFAGDGTGEGVRWEREG